VKRSMYVVLAGLAMAISPPTFGKNRAIEIAIYGIGPPADVAAVDTVRQVIGHAIGNGVIDRFIVTGYGIEGGFSACTQAAPTIESDELTAFVKQLRSVHPRPGTTAYLVAPTANCDADDQVACTQEAKSCPDGSYVGRQPPTCEFAPCP